MNRQLLVPIIALLALMGKQFYGVEMTSDEMDIITEGILAVAIFVGFLLNPKKKK